MSENTGQVTPMYSGPDERVGSSVSVTTLIAVGVAIVMVVVAFVVITSLSNDEGTKSIVIATGPETGTYHALGLALAGVLETEDVVASAEVQSTDGSVMNMEFVGGHERRADLAFIQSDTLPNAGVRLIAPLYQEVLHILVAKRVADRISTIEDLQGCRVSLGGLGSGTRQVAERVLEHFRVEVGEDLALAPDAVAEGLADGSIEAAFILTAIPSNLVELLCQQDVVRFLSLGDAQENGNEADALALVLPSMQSTVIPRSTYVRLPEKPVSTVEVSALLVASSELDVKLVGSITSTLFDQRSSLVEFKGDRLVVARRIREKYQPGAAVIPYHEGANQYYQRAEPPFFVAYAETLSLALTVLVGVYSLYIAFRQWVRRRMKNRIDIYYLEIEKLAADLTGFSLEELIEHRDALQHLQRRAFADLVAERLEANESFTIFQDYLSSEAAAIEVRIADKKTTG